MHKIIFRSVGEVLLLTIIFGLSGSLGNTVVPREVGELPGQVLLKAQGLVTQQLLVVSLSDQVRPGSNPHLVGLAKQL